MAFNRAVDMTVKALRDKALSLPLAQRLSLVGELWDSIAEDQQSLPLSEDHARIIDSRLEAGEKGRSRTVSWKAAVNEARRQVARKRKA
jgi:putative addiction module component (TIGR02574 family)